MPETETHHSQVLWRGKRVREKEEVRREKEVNVERKVEGEGER